MPAKDLQVRFSERFGGTPQIYRAPGRVNLIGEHTDYNEGYVMPLAIDMACWTAIMPRADRILHIYSENLDDSVEADLDSPRLKPSGGWSDYPLGVAAILQQSGYILRGANVYIRSEVPIGSGLSSSAAIEVAAAYALLRASNHQIEGLPLALLCQRAENEFVGTRCGIMDQFAACLGQQGKALWLDCRSLQYRSLTVPEKVALVVCNTKVKHAHAGGEYNLRRAECEEALKLLAATLPRLRALRDLTSVELERHRGLLTPTLYKRCRHVVTENERVQSAAEALEKGDIGIFGELMRASHRSLREDYEVSCAELEVMVDVAERQPGVYGARMTGGGFGGCTINLVEEAHSKAFQHRVAEEYQSATGIAPEIYLVKPSQGVQEA
jgi:galactokinase